MDFSKLNGLVPAVVQDATSNEVLMVGFMNDEAWGITQRSGYATFYSRSRNALWTKGETSGNKLAVRQILIDCDEDTVLLKVDRLGDGNVCHTGSRSCFTVETASGVGSRPASARTHSGELRRGLAEAAARGREGGESTVTPETGR